MSKAESLAGLPYELGRRLSDDAEVYEAIDIRNHSSCVIKFAAPKPSLIRVTARAARERLQIEAQKLSRWCRCRNVVRLLDARLSGTKPFIVLEMLGSSLEDLIPDEGMSFHESSEMLRDVAAALTDIHVLGDIFYDVKPQNVLRKPGGSWTLCDPGDEGFHTAEYSTDALSGWRGDILALGRTFVTAFSGRIDTGLNDSEREWLTDQEGGDQLHRLLQRMLAVRPREGRGGHPPASQVCKIANAVLALQT